MLLRIWNLLCSLKLAIWLASIATLLLMGGSLLVPFNPAVFGSMDQLPFGTWLEEIARPQLALTWWFYLAALFMVLFGINTLCCFCDWLLHLRSRWRKSGEYLLHLGVVLVLIAYIWGSVAGWRNNRVEIAVGELLPLADWPGHYLRLDSFEPVFGEQGPPLDMISAVTLLRGEQELTRAQVRMNSPLLRGGLVVAPVSFGQKPVALNFSGPGRSEQRLAAGDRLELANGHSIDFLRFVPDLIRRDDGQALFRDDRIGTPAYEIRIRFNEGGVWQGWYFPTRGLPRELSMAGFNLRPVSPAYQTYSVLTVNYDPGAPLAAVGGALMTVGVIVALFSFYRKRSRHDRPEV